MYKVINISSKNIHAGSEVTLSVDKLLANMYPSFTSANIYPLINDTKALNLTDDELVSSAELTFGNISGMKALSIPSVGADIQLPITALDLVGADGLKSYTFAVQFYIPQITTGLSRILFSCFDGVNGTQLKVNGTTGKLDWNITVGETEQIFSTTQQIKTGWNAVILNRSATDFSEIILNHVSTVFNSVPVPVVVIAPETLIQIAPGTGMPCSLSGLIYSPAKPLNYNSQYVYMAVSRPQLRLRMGQTDILIPNTWTVRYERLEAEDRFTLTIPPTVPSNTIYTASVTLGSVEGDIFSLEVKDIPVSETSYTWESGKDFPGKLMESFNTLNTQWGGANGGVTRENIEIAANGNIRIYANGDLYNGNIIGKTETGQDKRHTDENDPKVGEAWKTRVGGFLSAKEYRGYGSYTVQAKIPTLLGAAATFQLIHRERIIETDPRVSDFIAEGLSVNNGVVVRQHEISSEMPGMREGVVSHETFRCTTAIGLQDNERVTESIVAPNTADGLFHEYRVDWRPDSVVFYVDGVAVHTSTQFEPNIVSLFRIGLWFPSEPLAGKEWLTDPAKGWAGGTVDTDGGLKAEWDRQFMEISKFSFEPYNQTPARVIAETNPFLHAQEMSDTFYRDISYEFDLSEGDVGTLVFSIESNTWRGVDTYESEKLSSVASDLFSFKYGKIWHHSRISTNRNTFYGASYPSETCIATIGGNFKIKTWLTFSVEGSHAPVRTFLKDSENKESSLGQFNYDKREQVHYAPILRAGTGLQLYNGVRMRGSYIMILTQYKTDKQLQLKAFNIGFRESAGHEQI